MSAIDEAFACCRAERRAALVGYLTAYDPDRERSLANITAACRAGLDVLELGVPFSDPTADGPAIQAAMVRAASAGATLARVLELAAEIRRRSSVPMVLFSYANPLLRFGPGDLAKQAAEAGIDGLLVVDLPVENAGVLREPARAAGLDWIPLVAPTTPEARIMRIVQQASGFVYLASLKGVTGAALQAEDAALAARIEQVRAHTRLPLALGFGIRSPQQARAVGARADGVVVGTALVEAAVEGPSVLETRIRALREALGPR